MTSSKNPAVVLGAYLNRIIQSFVLAQTCFIILYAAYRLYIPSTTNSVTDNVIFGFTVALNAIAVMQAFIATLVPKNGQTLIEMFGTTLLVALVFEIYNITNILDTRHAISTVIISVSLVCLYVVFIALSVFLRLRFNEDDWESYGKSLADGKFTLWGYHNQETLKGQLNEPAMWLFRMISTLEVTVVYSYFVFALSIPIKDEGGYVFFFHISTVVMGFLHVGSTVQTQIELRTLYWIVTLACLEFVFDLSQLATFGFFSADGDNALYVSMRIILFCCSIGHVWAGLLSGVRLEAIDYVTGTFLLVRYGLETLVITQVCFVALYFAYVYSLFIDTVQWGLLLHAIPAFSAAVVCCTTEDLFTFKLFLKALIVTSILMFGYETVLAYHAEDLVVHIPLLIILFCEGMISASILSGLGMTMQSGIDAEITKYFKSTVKMQMDVSTYINFTWPRTKSDTDPADIDLMQRGGLKIYFLVSRVLQKIFLFEVCFLYFLIVIMAEQVEEDNDPKWYQWFYLLHFFPLVASALAWSFDFDLEMTTVFLCVSASICLVTDAFLFGFLVKDLSWAMAALLSLFFAVDIANITVCALMLIRSHPGFFVSVKFMHEVKYRIRISSRLDG